KLAALVATMAPDDAGPDARAAIGQALRRVVLRFADPDCSFLRPVGDGELEEDSVIDIGHEALIRRWDRLGGEDENWVREEQEDGGRYDGLLRLARTGALLPADELPSFEHWWERRRPYRAWARRYTKGDKDLLDKALGVLQRSRARVLKRQREEQSIRR